MTCVTSETLGALLDGELSQNDSSEMKRHIAGCERCRGAYARQREAIAVLRNSKALAVDSDFRAQTLRRLGEKKRGAWLALLPIAALGTLLVVLSPNEFTARGGSSSDVGCRFFGAGIELKEGSAVAPDSALAVDVFRSANAPRSLMVFAIDASDAVHWIHPAYLNVATDPRSIALAHEGYARIPESVVLASPQTGALQLVCLFSPNVLTVKQVEGAIVAKNYAELGDVQTLGIQLRSP